MSNEMIAIPLPIMLEVIGQLAKQPYHEVYMLMGTVTNLVNSQTEIPRSDTGTTEGHE